MFIFSARQSKSSSVPKTSHLVFGNQRRICEVVGRSQRVSSFELVIKECEVLGMIVVVPSQDIKNGEAICLHGLG